MKGRFCVTSFLFLSILILACGKESIRSLPGTEQDCATSVRPTATGIIVSPWQSISFDVERTNSDFSYSHSIPMPYVLANEEQEVFVFAHNLWDGDPLAMGEGEPEPLLLPFHFLPLNEKPGYIEQWNYQVDKKRLQVNLSINNVTPQHELNRKVQVRYVLVPRKWLLEKGQTPDALQHLTYGQFMHTLGLSS